MKRRRVLIVDDNNQNIQLAAAQLTDEQISVGIANGGEEALAIAAEEQFDLVLLDVMMPDMDGFTVCRKLKQQPQYRDVPVIFLTARSDKESVLEGFEAGGVDYVTKPFFGPELKRRAHTHLELRAAMQQLEEINAQLNKDILQSVEVETDLRRSEQTLAETNRLLHEQATTDELTGLRNRRSMAAILEYECERSARSGSYFAIVLCDIDHFKRVNDTYGHPCGDLILKSVASVLTSEIRSQDQVARWGGEEFLLLLPETSETGARNVAEKTRAAIAQTTTACDSHEIGTSMTFGVAEAGPGDSVGAVVERADRALYTGKSLGRNRVVVETRQGE